MMLLRQFVSLSACLTLFLQASALYGADRKLVLIYAKPAKDWESSMYLGYLEDPIPALTPPNIFRALKASRPRVDEKTSVSVFVFLANDEPQLLCKIEKKPYTQPSDSPVPSSQQRSFDNTELDNAWQELKTKLRTAPDRLLSLVKGDFRTMTCPLNTFERGGYEISYDLIDISGSKEKVRLQDEVQVHHLYRFRVMAGPVFSSLKQKDRNVSAVQSPDGTTATISSTIASNQPVNFPLLLKIYWHPDGRDLLEELEWNPLNPAFWKGLPKRINPIIGLNLFDNPLENFYAGGSFEFYRGVDLVTGFHWGKVAKLAPGLSEGQSIANPSVLKTEKRFESGWFLGMAVDIGVVGSWLKNTVKTVIP